MNFSVGYQMCRSDDFIDTIIKHKTKIEEVYFSWGNFANGRNLQIQQSEFTPWEAQERQIADLKKLYENGIKFNLLFNGNCYGKDSLSRAFYNKIGDTVQYICNNFMLTSITTTSPLIAKFVKDNFENIKTRASVNMKIGTIQGMDYLAPYFDGYYMKREFNRDFNAIKKLKNWCDENGKTSTAHNRSVQFTRPAREGNVAPDLQFQFRIAAVACGLGEIGWSKMLLTPEFGPLQRVAFIFTDAELEYDEMYSGKPLCRRCGACVRECPGSCIPPIKYGAKVTVNLDGSAVLYTENEKIQMQKCTLYNIPKGEWHHITVSENATVMVAENSNTSRDNTEKKLLK